MMRSLPFILLGLVACKQPETVPFINPESVPEGNPGGDGKARRGIHEPRCFPISLDAAVPRFVNALVDAQFQITFCHERLGLISFRQVWREDSEEARRNHTVEGTLRLREIQGGSIEASLLLTGRCSQLVSMRTGPETSGSGLTEANMTDLGPQQRQIIWDILEAACR